MLVTSKAISGRSLDRAVALAVLGLAVGVLPPGSEAQTGTQDVSALACTAAYQVDWRATTSPERSAADRKGAETTYEAWRRQMTDHDAANAAVSAQTARLESMVSSGSVSLPDVVAACDRAWGEGASRFTEQYAPPPKPAETNSEVLVFENTQSPVSDPEPTRSETAQCDTTDRRATGIMNTWVYALQDYVAEGVRDYGRERELKDKYANLRSRLEDEMTTAETYGCDSLARDIRSALSDWELPF